MTDATADFPRSQGLGWCHYHKGIGPASVTVDIVPGNSGPGYSIKACKPCREAHRLIPLDEQPPVGGPPAAP